MRVAHRYGNAWAAVVATSLVALLVLAGCGSPGADQSDETEQTAKREIATEGFEKLGPVTLRVWADAGEEATMKRLIPSFEKKYPNVTVDLTLRGFDDHIKLIVNAMAGDNPPDVAQGGHGFLTDGQLVKGGLIAPLDDYAAAYRWDDRFAADTLDYMRWTEGADTFGEGKLYGIAPITELVGVYYNEAKLKELGVELPRSQAEFEQVLAKAKAAGEQPIMLGNAEKYPAIHAYSVLHGQYVPAAEIREWTAGTSGMTIATPGARTAAEKMVEWARAGYFGEDFNGLSAEDAVSKFGNGTGVFMIAGSWNAPNLEAQLGRDLGFFNFPAGEIGKPAAAGTVGLPWHISQRSEHPDLGAAFLAMLHSEEFLSELVAVGRPPAQPGAKAPADGILSDVIAAAEEQIAAGGQLGSYDHSTATMLETFGSKLQEMLAGRTDPQGMLDAVQADWAEAHAG